MSRKPDSDIQRFVASYESISACQNFWKTFREEQYLISYQLVLAQIIADSYTPVISQLIFYVTHFHVVS